MRTVEWDSSQATVKLIDQRRLPRVFEVISYSDFKELANAIKAMVVRGAPAIGVTAAFGIALAAWHTKATTLSDARAEVDEAFAVLQQSRPTAVNLFWALDRMRKVADQPIRSIASFRDSLLEEAQKMADEDVAANLRMANYGASFIQDGDTIIHHCNTGALATVDWGTALGCIRMAHEQGKRLHVLVDETRPRLQGARLTSWELEQAGISYEIITDNSAGYFLRRGKVQRVFFGADRVAANGDVANKIGTYMLALAAHANRVPVYAVMPVSTIDLSVAVGDDIPIEERDPSEVLDIQIAGEKVTPLNAKALNPAFDITPHSLITALVTDRGVIYPDFQANIPITLM